MGAPIALPDATKRRYANEIHEIRTVAKGKFREVVSGYEWASDAPSLMANRDMAINVAYKVVTKYGGAAAANTAELCDIVSEVTGNDALIGKICDDVASKQVVESVHFAAGSLFNDDGVPDVEAFISRCEASIDKMIGQCTMETLRASESKPGEVRYERILGTSEHGNCPLCEELASKGPVWTSDQFVEPHDGCTCEFVPTVGTERIKAGGKATGGKYAEGYVEGSSNKYYSANLGFKSFEDVKQYLYGATSKEDLYSRYSNLMNNYPRDITSGQAVKNAVKHMDKRL